jgi:hypothetical protein
MPTDRYQLSQIPEERIVLALLNGLNHYFNEHEMQPWPGSTPYSIAYLTNYVRPFMERERVEVEETYLHSKVAPFAKQEREIAERKRDLMQLCNKLIDEPVVGKDRRSS